MKLRMLWMLGVLLGILIPGITNNALAQSVAFTTIDFPGAINTHALGINNVGDIVGYYSDEAGRHHGFLLSAGQFTSVDFPGTLIHDTEARAINDAGDIVGYLWNNRNEVFHFLFSGGQFASFGAPDAWSTIVVGQLGINNAGDMVGSYRDFYATRGFLFRGYSFSPPYVYGGEFTPIDVVTGQSRYTQAHGINNAADIVGYYSDIQAGQPRAHGFVLSNGQITSIDFPGVRYTYAHGINDAGDVVGHYAYFGAHGYLLSGGQFTQIDFPDAVETNAYGINNTGDIVGSYLGVDNRWHGYLLSGGQ